MNIDIEITMSLIDPVTGSIESFDYLTLTEEQLEHELHTAEVKTDCEALTGHINNAIDNSIGDNDANDMLNLLGELVECDNDQLLAINIHCLEYPITLHTLKDLLNVSLDDYEVISHCDIGEYVKELERENALNSGCGCFDKYSRFIDWNDYASQNGYSYSEVVFNDATYLFTGI